MVRSDENARPDVSDASRNRALIVLLVTLILGAGAWFLLGRAADSGIDRLARIDGIRAYCDALMATAANQNDTGRVLRSPVRDTVDAQSDKAIRTCGDLGVSTK
jgi:hypothetical protein